MPFNQLNIYYIYSVLLNWYVLPVIYIAKRFRALCKWSLRYVKYIIIIRIATFTGLYGGMMANVSTAPENYTAPTECPPSEIHCQYMFTLAKDIWIYGFPVLLIVGTAGNLSAVVMLRPGLRKLTTSLYLLVLAVVDTLLLYTGLLRSWILHLSGVDVRDVSTAGCRVYLFVVYVSTHLEAWILVCVAIERMVAVFFPHRAKQIFTRNFAAGQMAIMGTVLAIVNCHFCWMYELVDGDCTMIDHDHYKRYSGIFNWVDLSLASLLPFLIMLVANTAIGVKLISADRKRKARLHRGTDTKLTSMTAILFSISLVFLLTTAPVAVFINVYHKWYTGTTDSYARMTLASAILDLLLYTNYSINFLLYCVSAPRFRRELVGMFPRKAVESENTVESDDCGELTADVDSRM